MVNFFGSPEHAVPSLFNGNPIITQPCFRTTDRKVLRHASARSHRSCDDSVDTFLPSTDRYDLLHLPQAKQGREFTVGFLHHVLRDQRGGLHTLGFGTAILPEKSASTKGRPGLTSAQPSRLATISCTLRR